MMTGWFKDPSDMRWYYFHERPDGSMGHMYTGWNEIDGSWYFFGRDGRMMTGWRWINRRCYYMDPISGRMYSNTVTPDGFTVDATGAWTINGEVQTLKIPES